MFGNVAKMQTEDVTELRMCVDHAISNKDCCPICFDDEKALSPLSCPSKHIFCAECIDGYFKTLYISNQTLTCPICRHEVLPNTSAEYVHVREVLMQKYQQMHAPTHAHIQTSTIPIIRYRRMQHDAIILGNAMREHYNFERSLVYIMILILLIAFVIAMGVFIYH